MVTLQAFAYDECYKKHASNVCFVMEQNTCEDASEMGLMHITSQFFSSSAAYCMKSRLGGIA